MADSPDLSDLYDYQAKEPQQALDAALAAVRAFCGWRIAPSATETASVWSVDGRTLLLPTLNLTAVVSVTQDGATISPSSYTFDTAGTITGSFGRRSVVTVQFTHGYTTMPNDAKGVVLSLAQRSISDTRGLVTRQGPTGPTTPAFVETYGPQLGDADKDRLAPYTIKAGFAS